jgi:hypothetical protein
VATQRLSGMPTSASGNVLSRVYMQRINLTNFLCRRRQFWVIRDRVEPASSPAMSAMPPKAEVAFGCVLMSPRPNITVAFLI